MSSMGVNVVRDNDNKIGSLKTSKTSEPACVAQRVAKLKQGWCFVVIGYSFYHALHASGALTFLCFAKV